MVTTAENILAALKAVSVRPIEVAGLQVHVRGLNGTERKLLIERAKSNDPVQSYELAALCLCTPEGAALFTADQAAQLAEVDAASVETIATEILSASKLLPTDQEQSAKN